jgi:hypothetical protein
MLRFLLDRILPKERSVRVDLPAMDRSFDAVNALAAVIDAVGIGQIAPSEAAALASLFATFARIVDVTPWPRWRNRPCAGAGRDEREARPAAHAPPRRAVH